MGKAKEKVLETFLVQLFDDGEVKWRVVGKSAKAKELMRDMAVALHLAAIPAGVDTFDPRPATEEEIGHLMRFAYASIPTSRKNVACRAREYKLAEGEADGRRYAFFFVVYGECEPS